jgi:hypothetical protein
MSEKKLVSTTLTVTYESPLAEGDLSPGVLFHIPDTDIPCGGDMPMYLWASTRQALDGYVLFYEQESMGPGTPETLAAEIKEEEISFAETDIFQLELPIENLIDVTGHFIRGIFNEVGELVDTEIYEGGFVKLGGSGVGPVTRDKLYGNGIVRYWRGRFRKRWIWKVNCSKTKHWFFLKKDGIITRKFEITVDVDAIVPTTGERLVVIRIIEFSSLAPVENARVRVNGKQVGYTDQYGEVQTTLNVGTHNILITREGFVRSDEDDISNDQIEVR